jgi:endonuclease G
MRLPGLSGWLGRGLSGSERKQLREILLEGSSRDSLTTALAEAENAQVFEEIVGDGGYATQLRDLIHAADKGGWLPELVEAFASQTEREDLVERARAIVTAVKARQVGVGGQGGGPSASARNGTLLTGGIILVVAGAAGVYLWTREDEKPLDANLVVMVLDNSEQVGGRKIFVERLAAPGFSAQSQSAVTDGQGLAKFHVALEPGGIFRAGAKIDGPNNCWWEPFTFGGRNHDLASGLKKYALAELDCRDVVTVVASADSVAQALKSPNKGGFGLEAIDLPPANPRPSYAPLGLPGTGLTVQRTLYTYGFDKSVGTAQWVAFNVDASRARGERAASVFSPDPALPTWLQQNANSYNEGRDGKDRYDRGHLVPLSDMRIGKTDAENAAYQRESEYFPVVVPQSPGTNQRTWLAVDNYAREQSIAVGPVHVIAGPVYRGSGDQTILTLGPKGVPIPSFLYRVLLRRDAQGMWRAIGFVVPNDGSIEREARVFATSVSRIEQLTGITFFPDLDPALARTVKSNASADYFEGKAAQPAVR